MTSPTLELTGAIVARLKAHAPLTAIVSSRIYDEVPRNATSGAVTAMFPYVSIGNSFELPDDADCITGFEISFRLDCWSRAHGFPEVLRIAEAMRDALHKYDLTLSSNALVQIEHQRTDKLRDPDGKTSHAVVEFIALIEQP